MVACWLVGRKASLIKERKRREVNYSTTRTGYPLTTPRPSDDSKPIFTPCLLLPGAAIQLLGVTVESVMQPPIDKSSSQQFSLPFGPAG